MADPNEIAGKLDIRCPECRQRFSVGGNLMGRMVECGACASRFRVHGDVIMRSRKFYPGERVGPGTGRYQRVPQAQAPLAGLATVEYAEFNHPEQLGPASPQRILAGISGVALMVFTALMLIFATRPGGLFGSMPLQNKLIMAGFASLLGIILLLYANPKARGKAAAVGLMLAAGLTSLPFLPTRLPIAGDPPARPGQGEVEPLPVPAPEAIDRLAELRQLYVTKPLEQERQRLAKAGGETDAYGIFLTDMATMYKFTVRDFLIRETGALPSSHPYPRDDGNYLMVLSGVALDIGEVAEIAGRLGKTEEILEEIGVVVVSVDNSLFLAGSAEKLNDSADPAFYELNRYELGNIDLDRVERAVGRLAIAEPSAYRDEITHTLIGLLGKQGVNFQDSIAKALLVWAEEPDEAAAAGLPVLVRSVAAGEAISENLVDLVTKARSEEAIPTITLLWERNPDKWEKYHGRYGEAIVPGLVDRLGSDNGPLLRSAIRLLGELGTEQVVPELEKLSGNPDPEVRVMTERALLKIKDR